MKILGLVTVIFLALAASAQTLPPPPQYAAAFAKLDEFVAQQMKDKNIPGVALAITDRQRVLKSGTYGFADVKTKSPVTPDTLFQIGSISKGFTAIALLQLMEEGKFDPKAPITKYLPWFSVNTKFRALTGHDIMSHSAGLPRDRDDIPSSIYQAVALRERATGFAPGTHFYYSNIGYQVMGYALEAIARQPYPRIIQEKIMKPLEMTSSAAVINPGMRRRLATGYAPFFDDRPAPPQNPLAESAWFDYAAGDGSIIANATDMAAYVRMLLNHGAGPQARIISEQSFALLTQRAIAVKEGEWYGYGIASKEDGGHHILTHSGGMVGFSSVIAADLDGGYGVVVLINDPDGPEAIGKYAMQLMRAAHDGKPLPAPEDDNPLTVKKAADYAGTYTNQDGNKLQLVAEGDKLFLVRDDGRFPLERRGEDAFYVRNKDFWRFLLRFGREKGKVVEAFSGQDWYPNGRYTGPRNFEFPMDWLAYPGHYRSQQMWFNNFRIVLRKGKLLLITPTGEEEAVVPVEGDLFRAGDEEWSPERVKFDDPINGQTPRVNLSGQDYYRSFMP